MLKKKTNLQTLTEIWGIKLMICLKYCKNHHKIIVWVMFLITQHLSAYSEHKGLRL